ncbi:DMT family transporter [Paroceanicella profunda]|uniref:DMT family transporter n=1 Tax=Paroceanicella profunda TaxID=2579971 RepID=A0A5B8FH93_9RHOB|nr:DMT family transporter [Paroceanicella profunda]QDL91917.1 DMT family transporter [Paroceanicella profunda]
MTAPRLSAILLCVGGVWGLGIPFNKLATATGYDPLGIAVWQQGFALLILLPVALLRGAPLPLGRRELGFCAGVGVFGTLLPSVLSLSAVAHLPAGVAVIAVSTVPLFTLMIATALRLDRPTPLRLLGVFVGLAAIVLLASPEALPDPAAAPYLLLGIGAAAAYAVEGNWVARRSPPDMAPITMLIGAVAISLMISLPVAMASDRALDLSGPWGAADWALAAGACINVLGYVGYIWLIGAAGPVFSAQVGYVVTVAGVLWSMVVLSEGYSATVWAAMGLVLLGIALVQPRAGPGPA